MSRTTFAPALDRLHFAMQSTRLLLTGYLGADRATGLLPWHHPATPTWIDGPQAKALLLAGLLLLPALAAWAAAARRRSHPASALPRTVTP